MARTPKITTGLQRSLRKMRDREQLPPYFDVFAAIAGKLAEACDRAAEAGETRELVASAKLLREVLEPLGLAPKKVLDLTPRPAGDRGAGGAGSGDGGDADPAGAELAQLMGSGPTVGHTPDAGASHLRAAGGADR